MPSKKFKPIQVRVELKEKIQFLSQVTGMSQADVLVEILTPIFEIASTYNRCSFKVYSRTAERYILIQFEGFGNDSNLVLKQRTESLEQEQETEKVGVTEKTGIQIKGEIKK